MLFIIAAALAFGIVAIGFTALDVLSAAGADRPSKPSFTPYTGPLYTRHGREIVRTGKAVL